MQDLQLFGSKPFKMPMAFKTKHLEVMINPYNIHLIEEKAVHGSLGELSDISAISDVNLLKTGIKKCTKPDSFTFFKVLSFDKDVIQVWLSDDYYSVKEIFLTCGHAVNEYEKEMPVKKFFDDQADEVHVLLNMGIFSGNLMKDPISGVSYPIANQVAVLCKFYSKEETSDQSNSHILISSNSKKEVEKQENQTQITKPKIQKIHDSEKPAQQKLTTQIFNFSSSKDDIIDAIKDYQDVKQFESIGTDLQNDLIFTPCINIPSELEQVRLIGYVGDLTEVITNLNELSKIKITLKKFWPHSIAQIENFLQENPNYTYQEFLEQKAKQLQNKLLQISSNLCYSQGIIKKKNKDLLGIDVSSVQGQSGSPIVIQTTSKERNMLQFAGIHLSGPLSGEEYTELINNYILTYIPAQNPQSQDQKYNLALSVQSLQLKSVLSGLSKIAPLSQQNDDIKEIWQYYRQESTQNLQAPLKFNQLSSFKSCLFQTANEFTLRITISELAMKTFSLKEGRYCFLRVVEPLFYKKSNSGMITFKQEEKKKESQKQTQIYSNFSKQQRSMIQTGIFQLKL